MGAAIEEKSVVNFDDKMHKWLYGSHWGWIEDNQSKSVNTRDSSIASKEIDDNESMASSTVAVIGNPESCEVVSGTSSLWKPNFFNWIDEFLLCSLFRDASILTERSYHRGQGEEFVVKIMVRNNQGRIPIIFHTFVLIVTFPFFFKGNYPAAATESQRQ